MNHFKNIEILISAILIVLNLNVYSQTDTVLTETDLQFEEDETIDFIEYTEKYDKDSIYMFADHMPEFPGGKEEFKAWLQRNTNYPDIPREGAIEGTVYIKFEVTKTGHIGQVKILKGLDPFLDKEAVKIVKSLPAYKPGMLNKKPINCWMHIPIKFKLD